MKTLLTKVQQLEQEAQVLLEQTKQNGHTELQNIAAHEDQVMADLRQRASAKADAIIAEHSAQAKQEINQLQQETEQSVKIIHQTAAKNRSATVAYAHELFKQLYL